LAGFHFHIGSDINKLSVYSYAAVSLVRFLKSLDQKLILGVKYLDIGGGFPAGGLKPFYYKEWYPEPIGHYIKTVAKIIKPVFKRKNLPKLIVEPGRYLTDDSTMFITKIINCTNTPHGQVLTADGAITMLPLIYYRPQIVRLYSSGLVLKTSALQKSLVYGSTCKQDDVLHQKPLPAAKVNDYLFFFCTGAYNLNLSPAFIFNKPKTCFIN
jgi:diaminopimelate decarboxylase